MTSNINTLTPPECVPQPAHFRTPKLQVHKLDPFDDQKYTKDIVTLWIQTMVESEKIELNEVTRSRLADCEEVCQVLSRNLLSYSSDPGIQIFVCCDDAQREQGIMALTEEDDHIEIQELVTNPWNIAPEILPDSHPVKGAGKALMRAALKRNKTITLAAYPGAKSFYQSLGFQAKPNQSDSGCVRMVLERKTNAVYFKTKKAA